MLVGIFLLVGVSIASTLPQAVRPKRHPYPCRSFSHWLVVASGTVYCDARTRQVPESGSVTLMDLDDNPDDVATYDKALGGLKPTVDLVNGRFEVGGSMTDWWATDVPEPYLLIKGICPVENYNGVVERKHIEEKVGLPCYWECENRQNTIRDIEVLLDGVSDRAICNS